MNCVLRVRREILQLVQLPHGLLALIGVMDDAPPAMSVRASNPTILARMVPPLLRGHDCNDVRQGMPLHPNGARGHRAANLRARSRPFVGSHPV